MNSLWNTKEKYKTKNGIKWIYDICDAVIESEIASVCASWAGICAVAWIGVAWIHFQAFFIDDDQIDAVSDIEPLQTNHIRYKHKEAHCSATSLLTASTYVKQKHLYIFGVVVRMHQFAAAENHYTLFEVMRSIHLITSMIRWPMITVCGTRKIPANLLQPRIVRAIFSLLKM